MVFYVAKVRGPPGPPLCGEGPGALSSTITDISE